MKNTIIALLAVTFTIAGVLIYWGTSLINKTLIAAENTTVTTDCTSALFTLYSGSYDTSSKNMVLVLENKRNVDLEIQAVYLFYQEGEMKTFEVNEILKGNELKSLSVTGVDEGFQNIRIKTDCPEVSLEIAHLQIT